MRFVIILGAMLIAGAINDSVFNKPVIVHFLSITAIIAVVMDVVELNKKVNKK